MYVETGLDDKEISIKEEPINLNEQINNYTTSVNIRYVNKIM